MPKKKKINKDKSIHPQVDQQIRKAILFFLGQNPQRLYNHKQISAGAGLRNLLSHGALVSLLDFLAESGQLATDGRGRYGIVASAATREGRLEVVRDGFGFVVQDDPNQGEDIFIHPKNMGKALHGDRVKVRLKKASGGPKGRPEGEVIEILERGNAEFIGIIQMVERKPLFIPDDPRISTEFMIVRNGLKGAEEGDKVIVKLAGWDYRLPDGEVVRVLGKAGENNTEMHAILFQFGFQPEFPEGVEAEAEAIPKNITPAEIKKRRDFRKILTLTIDPYDAKDFDDAISFQILENGNFEVGVHIADVSHYVRPGTRIDEEAYHRGTSVYLVDRTVPMLPEALSNDLCSLKPEVDRLAFSAVFEMDAKAKVVNAWYGKSIIHSNKRFAYEEAQEILEKGEGLYAEELKTLNQLAYALRKDRFKRGSINFEDDEVKFQLDEKGKPIRVFRKVRKDAHKLIEDFMLLANRKVAEHVAKLRKTPELPFVYRVHDRPDPEKLENLRRFVSILGHELDLSDERHIHLSLNRLMTDVEGKPEQDMVQSVAVRAMAKAIYSTQNIGHYGLAFPFYTHFTSPIRRYPDLMVHRLLEQYLSGDYNGSAARLDTACNHSSKMERKAVEAERASVKHKQVEYLEERLGEEYEGIVTGVTGWGFYVELVESRCEGMVGLHDLQDDFYEVDLDHYCLRGRSTGSVIRLGDKVLIEVKGVDLKRRQIDFHFVELLEGMVRHGLDTAPVQSRRKGGSRTKPAPKAKRGGPKTGGKGSSKGKPRKR